MKTLYKLKFFMALVVIIGGFTCLYYCQRAKENSIKPKANPNKIYCNGFVITKMGHCPEGTIVKIEFNADSLYYLKKGERPSQIDMSNVKAGRFAYQKILKNQLVIDKINIEDFTWVSVEGSTTNVTFFGMDTVDGLKDIVLYYAVGKANNNYGLRFAGRITL